MLNNSTEDQTGWAGELAHPRRTNLSNAGVIKEGETEMIEEPIQSFPLPNQLELAHVYIKTELESAGIEVQRISIDHPAPIDCVVITTDREVPEEIKSRIREYAADKGITVRFEVSGQEN
jgi:hypothetical protein